jgi:hypothetical protein
MLYVLTQPCPRAQVDLEHSLTLEMENQSAVQYTPKKLQLTFWSSRKEIEEGFSWRGDEGKQVWHCSSLFQCALYLESEHHV